MDTSYFVKIGFGTCFINDTIRVKSILPPIANAGKDIFHCPSKSVQLSGSSNGSTVLYWKSNLYFTDTLKIPQTVSVSGTYRFILVAKNNECTSYDTVLVEEKPKPIASFDLDPMQGFIPFEVNIKNKSTSPANYQWFLNNSFLSGTMLDSTLKINTANDYQILLIVTDEFGCIDSISKTFKANFEPKLSIPNVFTPNKDGVNDEFKIDYTIGAFETIEYEIYNRWGQLLYVANIHENPWWNGESNGEECSPGVYFYIFYAKTKNGKTYNSRGTLTLIRQ